MKQRHGFVSNSSSSSFLLVFDKKPTGPEDIKKMIWPDSIAIGNPYDATKCYPISQAIESVWSQIEDQKPKSVNNLADDFESSEEVLNLFNYSSRDTNWDKRQSLQHIKAQELAKEFKKECKGKFVYSVSFSDNEGDFQSTMEHGDVFKNIKSVRFSHH